MDVLAHPDVIKVAGHRPDAGVIRECHERMAVAGRERGTGSRDLLFRLAQTRGGGVSGAAVACCVLPTRRPGDDGLGHARDGPRRRTARRPRRAGARCRLRVAPGVSFAPRPRRADRVPGVAVIASGDLAQQLTGLDTPAVSIFERLMASWSILADLSFSDLLLYVPVDEYSLADATRSGELSPEQEGVASIRGLHFVVVGQIRPGGNPTVVRDDLVGRIVDAASLPLVMEAWESGVITTGEWSSEEIELPARELRTGGLPQRRRRRPRPCLVAIGRPPQADARRAYLPIFGRLARMVRAGTFPFKSEDEVVEDPPRVGDGVIVLDVNARVTFASPNAIEHLHRVGVVGSIVGTTFEEMGIESQAIAEAFNNSQPAIEEIERRPETIVVVHCMPLLDEHRVVGAAVLVRDVTDLRRRDRLLLSKDAAIREVHHRVKNNLQTISSLLRLGRAGSRTWVRVRRCSRRNTASVDRGGARNPRVRAWRPGPLRGDRADARATRS